MSEVTVTINSRSYLIACDDGQEEQLLKLAKRVDGKVSDLVSALGQIGDQRLLVMAALLIADEAEQAQQKPGRGGDQTEAAKRIEALAARLDGVVAGAHEA